MDVYDAIKTRRSIRKFSSERVPKEKIIRILEAANLAPTASNRQPWEFVVVDRSVLDELREITDRSFKERVEEVGRGSFKDYLRNVSIPMEESEDKVDALNRFYRTLGEAPVAIVVYVNREEDPWQWKNNICDASAAIENLILAAWNLGLGSCWMAGPLKKKGQEIQTFLGIPDEKDIVGIIPIGIPAHNPPPPPKVGVETKIKWIGL